MLRVETHKSPDTQVGAAPIQFHFQQPPPMGLTFPETFILSAVQGITITMCLFNTLMNVNQFQKWNCLLFKKTMRQIGKTVFPTSQHPLKDIAESLGRFQSRISSNRFQRGITKFIF